MPSKKKDKSSRHARRNSERVRKKQPSTFSAGPVKIMGPTPGKEIAPSANPPLPEAFAKAVGSVALTWTYLEDAFITLLASLEAASPPSENALRKTGFSDLVERWRRAQSALITGCPSLASHLADLLDRLGEYQWRRNFLIHGKTHSVLTAVQYEDFKGRPAFRIDAKLVITSQKRINGRKETVTEEFTLASLDDMFHAVAHIAGQLRELALDDPPPMGVAEPDWARWRSLMIQHPAPMPQ